MELLLLTPAPDADVVLPGLSLLSHRVRIVAPTIRTMLDAGRCDVMLIDARNDPVGARGLCRLLNTTGTTVPIVAVVTETGLVTVATDWMIDDLLLPGAGPGEIDVRLRLLHSRTNAAGAAGGAWVFGELMIDESTYTSRLSGRPLELTYKEFELLKYLARHPGRVVTRAELLREIWGHDFYGGIRTVDVHIRRLRAKLGPEHQKLIGTVRSVGYRFLRPAHTRAAPSDTHAPEPPAGRDRIATGSAGFPLPDAEACCRVDEIVGGGSAQTPAGNPASSCG